MNRTSTSSKSYHTSYYGYLPSAADAAIVFLIIKITFSN